MKRVAEVVETTELCCYGCGLIAHYRNGSGNLMCEDRHNKCPANKLKNSLGLKRLYDNGRDAKAIYASAPKSTKAKMAWNKGIVTAEFTINGKGQHKKVLINERGHICENCKLTKWLELPIPLELEHIDGNNKNNIKENLLLLCPNCHSLTPTYRGRGTNTGRKLVTDEDLINALVKFNMNVSKALSYVNMTPKGSNYNRCYDLIVTYKLT